MHDTATIVETPPQPVRPCPACLGNRQALDPRGLPTGKRCVACGGYGSAAPREDAHLAAWLASATTLPELIARLGGAADAFRADSGAELRAGHLAESEGLLGRAVALRAVAFACQKLLYSPVRRRGGL